MSGGDFMEQRILEVFEALTVEQQEMVITYAQNLLETQRRTEAELDLCPKADLG